MIRKDKIRRDQLMTVQDLSDFGEELLRDINKLLAEQSKPTTQWLKAAEAKALLRISAGKLQYLRDQGVIPFTKLGGVTYYKLSELEDLMQSGKLDE